MRMSEIYRSLPEGTPVQLINDKIIMSPAPNIAHQRVLLAIYEALKDAAKGRGEIFIAPTDVILDDANTVQPDVFFVPRDNEQIIKGDAIHGVPAIIVEVLSTNRQLDLVKKKLLYEKFKVYEYFIVDPETRQVVSYYLESRGFFSEVNVAKDQFHSRILAEWIVF